MKLEAGRAPKVSWRVLEKNIPPFNPVTGKCQLCIREKFYIIFKPHLASLNQRQEIFSNCRHKKSKLLIKAPDWDLEFIPAIRITFIVIFSFCICLSDDWHNIFLCPWNLKLQNNTSEFLIIIFFCQIFFVPEKSFDHQNIQQIFWTNNFNQEIFLTKVFLHYF